MTSPLSSPPTLRLRRSSRSRSGQARRRRSIAPLLALVFALIVAAGVLFPQKPAFAILQFGGRIMQWVPTGAMCPPYGMVDPLGRWCGVQYHVIGPPRPSLPQGVICPLCGGPMGVGRLFLGLGVPTPFGVVITMGGISRI